VYFILFLPLCKRVSPDGYEEKATIQAHPAEAVSRQLLFKDISYRIVYGTVAKHAEQNRLKTESSVKLFSQNEKTAPLTGKGASLA